MTNPISHHEFDHFISFNENFIILSDPPLEICINLLSFHNWFFWSWGKVKNKKEAEIFGLPPSESLITSHTFTLY